MYVPIFDADNHPYEPRELWKKLQRTLMGGNLARLMDVSLEVPA